MWLLFPQFSKPVYSYIFKISYFLSEVCSKHPSDSKPASRTFIFMLNYLNFTIQLQNTFLFIKTAIENGVRICFHAQLFIILQYNNMKSYFIYHTKRYPRKYSIFQKCGKLSRFYLFKDNKITTDNADLSAVEKTSWTLVYEN